MALLATSTSTGGAYIIIWLVIIFAMMYFLMIRPQRKEQSRKNTMMSDLAIGDTILTSSGFYGTVIDIQEDMVIVEFGSNKNCRIPMQKAAIADVEKPQASTKPVETKADKKVAKKAVKLDKDEKADQADK